MTKGLTTLQQLGFNDVDYSSGNFSKQMLTSHHFANGHVPHYWQFSTTQTSKEKPTAIHCEEALDFSKPRCSYLPHVWYPLGERQLHPTNHCHH
jgi:hypothetical protein